MPTKQRIFLCLLIVYLLAPSYSQARSEIPLSDYVLVPESSILNFVATKDAGIKVQGTIKEMSGEAKLRPEGNYQIKFLAKLLNLQTGEVKRDKNIKEIFFETPKNPAFHYALWYSKTNFGDTELNGELTIHDVRIPVKGKIKFSYPVHNQIIVETTESMILLISQFKLQKQLATLIKVCGHKNVDDKVEINFKLLFQEK